MKREILSEPYERLKIMLDSGAFSAWMRNKRLSTKNYSRYLNEHEGAFSHIANMDVIPGTRGYTPNRAEVDHAAEASHHNFVDLRNSGHRVFPVYHYGEDPKWLDLCLLQKGRLGADFMGIGGLVGVPKKERRHWLDQIFPHIKKKRPDIGIHGFGLTDFELMRRYPWTSVDSMSWLILSTTGVIYLPLASGRVATFTISDDLKERVSGFDSMGPNEQIAVREWIRRIGSNEKDIRRSYLERGYANIKAIYYVLMDTDTKVFLTASSRGYDRVLDRAGSNHRLMTYFDLRRVKAFDPEIYARTGCSRLAKGLS